MGRLNAYPAGEPHSSAQEPPKPAEIVEALGLLLASPAFAGSRRSQQFLRYICEKALEGKEGTLKERTIAVEVFGRPLNADLGEDTIVRVGAREVRKRLSQAYSVPPISQSPLRISLPSGSYVPEFRFAEPNVTPPSPPVADPAPVPLKQKSRKRQLIGIAAVAAIILAAVWFQTSRPNPADQAFNRFWGPVFASSDPFLLVVSNPLVYHASSRAIRLNETRLPHTDIPQQRPIQLRPDEITGNDLIPVQNQYVGFGDMVVGTEAAVMLARHKKDVRVRLASSVSFADLRQTQSLLIGAITNRWTMELGQQWRYQFRTDQNNLSLAIADTKANPPVAWRVHSAEDGSVTEDYVLISRIVRSTAGGVQIVAAGIKQFGTEAAGRVLTDPAYIRAIASRLPADWDSKNLQLVLHVKVIGNAPDQPELVAAHVW